VYVRRGDEQGLKARGNVEDWLGKVEESMFVCLRKLIRAAVHDYEHRPREDWVLLHASQVRHALSLLLHLLSPARNVMFSSAFVSLFLAGLCKNC